MKTPNGILGVVSGLAALLIWSSKHCQASQFQCYECLTHFNGSENKECLNPVENYNASIPLNESTLILKLCLPGYVCGKYGVYHESRAKLLVRGCFRFHQLCPTQACYENTTVGFFHLRNENITAAASNISGAVSTVCLCDKNGCNKESGLAVTEGSLSFQSCSAIVTVMLPMLLIIVLAAFTPMSDLSYQ